MSFLPQLPPAVAPLLNPTTPLGSFLDAFLNFFAIFLINLAVENVRDILGESEILGHLIQHTSIQIIALVNSNKINRPKPKCLHITYFLQH